MSFEDRYGSTKIIEGRVDNLSISIDEIHRIGLETEDDEIGAVFLYTPDMENTSEHHHIALNLREARILRDWLNKLLEHPKLAEKFRNDWNQK